MANTYWLTFRIHNETVNGKTYSQRYDAFYNVIKEHLEEWWVPPTSFVAFSSESSIDAIAAALKAPLSARYDMFLLGMADYKSGRIFGKNDDQDIFKLMPFLKEV